MHVTGARLRTGRSMGRHYDRIQHKKKPGQSVCSDPVTPRAQRVRTSLESTDELQRGGVAVDDAGNTID